MRAWASCDLLGSCLVSGIADRPDWLVRKDQPGQSIGRHASQPVDDLPIKHRFGLAGLALLQSLADAEDYVEIGGEGNPHLLVDERIGFAQLVPALAMAENDIFAAEIEEHRWADLAGECAFFLGIEILRPERNAAALKNLPDKGKIGKWRTNGDGYPVLNADAIDDRLG